MKIKVVSVQENRGVRRSWDGLETVPNSLIFLVQLELEDGRTAFLTGPGESLFKDGEVLNIVSED